MAQLKGLVIERGLDGAIWIAKDRNWMCVDVFVLMFCFSIVLRSFMWKDYVAWRESKREIVVEARDE